MIEGKDYIFVRQGVSINNKTPYYSEHEALLKKQAQHELALGIGEKIVENFLMERSDSLDNKIIEVNVVVSNPAASNYEPDELLALALKMRILELEHRLRMIYSVCASGGAIGMNCIDAVDTVRALTIDFSVIDGLAINTKNFAQQAIKSVNKEQIPTKAVL